MFRLTTKLTCYYSSYYSKFIQTRNLPLYSKCFILQAYEKEDEAPAAAPAEKKEKAVEKVNATYNELSALVPCHLQGVF